MARNSTLLELLTGLIGQEQSEAELLATVVRLVNSDEVALCGNFRGHHFTDAEVQELFA